MSSPTSLKALFYLEQNYAYAVLRPLQEEIQRRGGVVRWFLVGDEIDASYLREGEERLKDVSAVKAWSPNVVFVPGNVVPRFLPGLKVGVFHGFAAGKVNRRGRLNHFEIRRCFDLYCTQGPSTTEPFQKLQQQYGFFEVIETGWPMVDPLFKPVTQNPYTDSKDPRPTVLFCSTFSRKYSCAEHVFDTVKSLKSQGNYRWLVQFHPKMARETIERYKSLQDDNLQFVETDNVIPLLQAADVMLCDTSSILLMFLLLNKPVVTVNNSNAGPHLLNVQEAASIETALVTALSRPADLMQAIQHYNQQMHPYTDGQSSARIVDAVEHILMEGLKVARRKPANWIREFKMRKQLNYWWV